MYKSLFACAVVAAVLSVPSHAGALDQSNRVVVSYSDLDLSRPAGVNVLLSRLQSASATVCNLGQIDNRDLSRRAAYRACFAAAMDGAVASVHQPLVAQLYGKPELVASRAPGSMTVASVFAH